MFRYFLLGLMLITSTANAGVIGSLGSLDNLVLGGRTIVATTNQLGLVSATRNLIYLHAYAGSNSYTTFAKMDSIGTPPAAYQVPSGKKFLMTGFKCVGTGATTAQGLAFVNSSNSVSSGSPTAMITAIALNTSSVQERDSFSLVVNQEIERATSIPFINMYYVTMFSGLGVATACDAWGYEL